jgi:phenylalanyl-tRNA synthetase alpha chain
MLSSDKQSVDNHQLEALSASLKESLRQAHDEFASAADLDALHRARVAHLGDRSPVLLARRELGQFPKDARADAGKRVNIVIKELTADYQTRKGQLEHDRNERIVSEEVVDVTLPTDRRPRGARHPLSALMERMIDVCVGMGYTAVEGPEVEAEWLNFDALNIPPDHPAREMQDTLYVAPERSGLVMRTQTSPVQVRALLEFGVPLYVVSTGRTFRNDELDATHSPVFHQMELIAVDEGLSMANLKGTLEHFAKIILGNEVTIRLRPSYFPFVEPGAEFDVRCFLCHGTTVEPDGTACRTCNSGWIEWGGCGMVQPRVLTAAGIDSHRYSGFAFGFGVERTLMFRHGVKDMHDIVENDARFSRAFGMEV